MTRPITSFAGSLDQVLVVVTPAALDHIGADPVRQAVVDLLPDRDDAAVVLDCSACELITSIGIAALLEIREFCAEKGVPLRVAALADEPRAILRMLRLEGKFTYADCLEDAIAAVE